MELMDVIKARRSVRNYTHAGIERSKIERLINSAILAPSAMNLQPWAFAAVLDRERIDDYAKRAKNWLLAKLEETSFSPSARQILEVPDFTLFYHAPALLLVLAKSSAMQASEDCCLAAETMMLAARDEGIGTCWIGFWTPVVQFTVDQDRARIAGTLPCRRAHSARLSNSMAGNTRTESRGNHLARVKHGTKADRSGRFVE
jgi:nitroreductase